VIEQITLQKTFLDKLAPLYNSYWPYNAKITFMKTSDQQWRQWHVR